MKNFCAWWVQRLQKSAKPWQSRRSYCCARCKWIFSEDWRFALQRLYNKIRMPIWKLSFCWEIKPKKILRFYTLVYYQSKNGFIISILNPMFTIWNSKTFVYTNKIVTNNMFFWRIKISSILEEILILENCIYFYLTLFRNGFSNICAWPSYNSK